MTPLVKHLDLRKLRAAILSAGFVGLCCLAVPQSRQTPQKPTQRYPEIRERYQRFARIANGLHWIWERKSDPGTPAKDAFDDRIEIWRMGGVVVESHRQISKAGNLSDRVRIAQPGLVVHVFYSAESLDGPSRAIILPDSQTSPTTKMRHLTEVVNGTYGLGATKTDPFIDPVLMLNVEPYSAIFYTETDGFTNGYVGAPQMLGERTFTQRRFVFDHDLKIVKVQLISFPTRNVRFEGKVTQSIDYKGFKLPSLIRFTEWPTESPSEPRKPIHYSLKLISVDFGETDFKLPLGLPVHDYRNQAQFTEASLGRDSETQAVEEKLRDLKPLTYRWSGSYPIVTPGQFLLQPKPKFSLASLPWNLILGVVVATGIIFSAILAVRREIRSRK